MHQILANMRSFIQWSHGFKYLGLVETLFAIVVFLPLVIEAKALWIVVTSFIVSIPRLLESPNSNRLAVVALNRYWEHDNPSFGLRLIASCIGSGIGILALWVLLISYKGLAQWIGAFSLLIFAMPIVGFKAGYCCIIAPNRQSANNIFENDGLELARSVFHKPSTLGTKPRLFSFSGFINVILAFTSWPSAIMLYAILMVTGIFISVGSFLGVTLRALFIRIWSVLICLHNAPDFLVDNYINAVISQSVLDSPEVVSRLPQQHDLNFAAQRRVGFQPHIYERILQIFLISFPVMLYRFLFKCSALVFAPIAYSFSVPGRYASHLEKVQLVDYTRNAAVSILGVVTAILACLGYFGTSIDWPEFIGDLPLVGDAPKTVGVILYIGIDAVGIASLIVLARAAVSIVLFFWADSFCRKSKFFDLTTAGAEASALSAYLYAKRAALRSFLAMARFSKALGFVWLFLAFMGLLTFADVQGLLPEIFSSHLRPVLWVLFGYEVGDGA